MEITLEKIDLLRKRANVSYKEAKQALEENEGNVVEALAYLEEIEKIKPEKDCNASTVWKKTKGVYEKSSCTRFVISRDNANLLNISVPLALLVSIIAMPLAVSLLVLAVLTGCKVRFIKNSGEECDINSRIDRVTTKASDLADKVVNEIREA
jgi:hypothetical protein